jgi:hypothetical protein
MVAQSCLEYAMPPRISFDEFDTEAPSNVNDDDMDESTTELTPYPKCSFTSTSIQLLLLESFRTRLQILQRLNGLNTKLLYDEVVALSSDIIAACQVHDIFTKSSKISGITPFHRNLLDYQVRRFLIPPNSHFSCQARTNPLYYNSRKVSLDAVVALISPEPDEGFSNVMTIGGGLFRDGFRHAMAIITLELIAHTEV